MGSVWTVFGSAAPAEGGEWLTETLPAVGSGAHGSELWPC